MQDQSLERRVYEHLEEGILSGRYKPGSSLSELSVSRELNTSRTPVREALFRLRDAGLIDLIPNKGGVVLGVSKSDLIDIYRIRQRLEGLAASIAAQKISPEELKTLREIVDLSRFYVDRCDPDKLKELDTDFHQVIYRACKSRILEKTLSDLHKTSRIYRKLSLTNPKRIRLSIDEHEKILEALEKGDAAMAEKITTEHVLAALNNLLEMLAGGKE